MNKIKEKTLEQSYDQIFKMANIEKPLHFNYTDNQRTQQHIISIYNYKLGKHSDKIDMHKNYATAAFMIKISIEHKSIPADKQEQYVLKNFDSYTRKAEKINKLRNGNENLSFYDAERLLEHINKHKLIYHNQKKIDQLAKKINNNPTELDNLLKENLKANSTDKLNKIAQSIKFEYEKKSHPISTKINTSKKILQNTGYTTAKKAYSSKKHVQDKIKNVKHKPSQRNH